MKSTIAILLLAAASLSTVRAEEAKTFPAAGVKSIDVRTESGAIRIDAAQSADVAVTVTNADPSRCVMILEPQGDRLVLSAKRKSKWSWSFRSECKAGFKVLAPKRLAAAVASGSGDIRVAEISGDLSLKTGSGDIQIYDVSGELTAKTGSGKIEGNTRAAKVDAHSGSGSIKLVNLSGDADVKTGSGDIDLSWGESPKRGSVEVKTGSGEVTLRWTRAPESADVNVKTGSGNIVFVIPEKTPIKTNLRTGSGRVTNALGDSDGAKLKITAKTGSGDVTIKTRG